jgi:hypothetical protein
MNYSILEKYWNMGKYWDHIGIWDNIGMILGYWHNDSIN